MVCHPLHPGVLAGLALACLGYRPPYTSDYLYYYPPPLFRPVAYFSLMTPPLLALVNRGPGERGMAIPLAEPLGHSIWDRGEGLFAEAPRDGGFYLCDCAGSVSDPRTPKLFLEYVRSSVTDVFGHH